MRGCAHPLQGCRRRCRSATWTSSTYGTRSRGTHCGGTPPPTWTSAPPPWSCSPAPLYAPSSQLCFVFVCDTQPLITADNAAPATGNDGCQHACCGSLAPVLCRVLDISFVLWMFPATLRALCKSAWAYLVNSMCVRSDWRSSGQTIIIRRQRNFMGKQSAVAFDLESHRLRDQETAVQAFR